MLPNNQRRLEGEKSGIFNYTPQLNNDAPKTRGWLQYGQRAGTLDPCDLYDTLSPGPCPGL